MTIHALCGALLRRFPLEAGVAPHFETIDDRTSRELIAEARERVLRAARDRATPLGRALRAPGGHAGGRHAERDAGRGPGRSGSSSCASRDACQGGTVDALIAAVYRAPRRRARPGSRRRSSAGPARDGIFDAAGLARLAAAFAAGGKKQQEAGASVCCSG